jgi:hypothetical protein
MRVRESLEPAGNGKDIFSSLAEIFDGMERLIGYIMGKRRSAARWNGIVAWVLASSFAAIMLIILDAMTGMHLAGTPLPNPSLAFISFASWLGFLFALGLPVGIIAYIITKRRYLKEYIPWKNSLDELKRSVANDKAEGVSYIETTLQIMDRASEWLPDLPEYKSREAAGQGTAAFILSVAFLIWFSPIWLVLPVAFLIGVMVWLYFRNEKRVEADRLINRFGSWKKRLEDGKSSILESI